MEASDDTRESHVVDDRHTTLGRLSPDTAGSWNGESSLSSLNGSNVVHQRRRVNPESLAQRLGPDLVRDLNALITPGNTEMPSFAVRKELQERYCTDRRHIYDYFHSRGLRVVKEDKHGNPVTAKDLSTGSLVVVHLYPKSSAYGQQPSLRPVRHIPIKNSRSHPYPPASQRKLLKPRGITKVKPGRPKKLAGSTKIVPGTCETNESTDPNISVSEHSSPVADRSTYIAVNPLLPHDPPTLEKDENPIFSSVVNPLDKSFSVRRAIGDVAYAYRHKPVFERMQELTEYPVKYDESLSWNEASPCAASAEGFLPPHAKPLSLDERHSMYEALSDSIGPVQGIQERQGTYRKHMEARTKLYFDGLLSVPYHHAQPSARTTTSIDRKAPLGTNEFRHWLSETRFLKRDANSSPLLHADYRNANVAKHQDADGVADKFNQRSIPPWLPTLDELFPSPRGNLHNDDPLTDSPIVHTREITRTTALGDGCSAGDHQLFSVISTSSLPIHPSVAETRQPGQTRSSGMPGPREVTMPVARTNSHLQWSEQEYVSYPGHHLASSDKLRRGRKASNNSRIRLPSNSPRMRDLDKTRTRPVTSCDARRRTTSAAGDI